MRKFALLTTTLALFAAPALAQSELDRLEAATLAASGNLETFLTTLAPELADVMPDWTWDEALRAAADCTLDAVRAEGGDAAVTSYISSMEVFAETPITSMQQMATATPVPINADFAARAGQTCGSAEIAMRRMQESGMMEAMMDPAVMSRLIGQ